jgi:hypothetical protein
VITDELHGILTRNCFGDIWSRPGLTRAHLCCGIPAMVEGFATASGILGDDLTMED